MARCPTGGDADAVAGINPQLKGAKFCNFVRTPLFFSMKFQFIWVGKTKDRNWNALEKDYLTRLSRFVQTDVREVKDARGDGGPEIEGKRILESLNQKGFVILVDVGGKQVSSHELAANIENWQMQGHKEVTFIVGGPNGVSPSVAEIADSSLSLSFMTFPHEMARVILLEQLYRGFSIIKGFPYQK